MLVQENRVIDSKIIHVVNRLPRLLITKMGYVAQHRKHLDSLESYTKMFENKMEILETKFMVIASATQGLVMIEILQNDLNVIQVEYSYFRNT